MKTIKVGRELLILDNQELELPENEIVRILHSYRAELIQSLISSGLALYVELRFNQRISPQQRLDLERNLLALAHSPIMSHEYSEIRNSIRKFDYVVIPGLPFYLQIDERLRANLVQTEIRFRSSIKRTPRINVLTQPA